MEDKYRLLTFQPINQFFDDISFQVWSSEGEMMAVNHKYIAIPQDGHGSEIMIENKNNPHRVDPKKPLIRASFESCVDLHWSPFIKNLLSVSSSDGIVKLFQVPEEEDFKQEIKKETQKHTEHTKKIVTVKFHPCSKDVISSCSFGKELNTWSVETGQSFTKMLLEDVPTSLDWNKNGSLLGLALRNKHANLVDPRSQQITSKIVIQEGSKVPKLLFVDPNYFITCGFTATNTREMKLFDLRKPEICISALPVGNSSNVMNPWYDYDTGIIFVPSKGEATVFSYQFTEGKIVKANEYKNNKSFTYFTHSEKRHSDYKSNEFFKFFAVNGKKLELYSIRTLRKSGVYDPNLFPPTFNGMSVISGKDWMSGMNADYQTCKIEELGPEGDLTDFRVKEEGFINTQAPLEEQVRELTAKVQSLTEELNCEKAINSELRNEIEKLKAQLGC